MGNRCLTVAVDSGATPKTGGITKPQRGAQKADDPISLHTCISEEVQKQLADTPFVEKEEAREVGLCRGVHLGLQTLTEIKHSPPTGRAKEQLSGAVQSKWVELSINQSYTE